MIKFTLENIDYKSIFLRFLKHFGLYNKFIRNIAKQTYIENFKTNKIKPLYYIDHAFIWKNTSEGHIFWSKLDDAWRDITKDIECHFDKYCEITYNEIELIFIMAFISH